MKLNYLTFIFCLLYTMSYAQNVNPIEISGQIIADSLDVEGVTIYNIISKKGVATDTEGKFVIQVSLNDKLEISALQFQKITVTVDENIIKSREVSIVLIERVNELNEVVILPFGLTGNLKEDIVNAKILNPNYDALYFGLANLDEFEFEEDYSTKVRNRITTKGDFYNGADLGGIVRLLLSPLLKSKKKNDKFVSTVKPVVYNKITDKYSEDYLIENLGIPRKEIKSFIYFIEDNGLNLELLKKGREFELLDYLIKQRDSFLNNNNDKN